MFELRVENKAGQQFTLTSDETKYQVISIDGLNPPKAIINSSTIAGMDGARFSSSKLEVRNLVLTIRINGNVEENRLFLYSYFKSKQYCKIYFKNDSRDVYAEGYVESIECDLFENGQSMQIAIICHDPYLKALDEIVYDLSNVISQFEFPFAIESEGIVYSNYDENRVVNVINQGDAESGVVIELTALGSVTNPTITRDDTQESFGVNCTMSQGDVLTINSNAGEKSVTLTHNGVISNYLKYITRRSVWLKVNQGDNLFTYSAENGEENLQVVVKFRAKYESV